jgi:hypothetical protein
MSFDSITSFFSRFKKITPPDEFVRKTAVEILQEVVGVKLNISHISVEGGILRIKNNSFIKSEVFLHKEQILQLLREKLGSQAPKDIL